MQSVRPLSLNSKPIHPSLEESFGQIRPLSLDINPKSIRAHMHPVLGGPLRQTCRSLLLDPLRPTMNASQTISLVPVSILRNDPSKNK